MPKIVYFGLSGKFYLIRQTYTDCLCQALNIYLGMAGKKYKLNIRDTGISILEILDLMARGLGYEAIIGKYPMLLSADIAYAAATARHLIIRYWAACGEVSDAVMPIREKRSPQSWTADEDIELLRLFQSGAGQADLARLLRRTNSDIKHRLDKLRDNQKR